MASAASLYRSSEDENVDRVAGQRSFAPDAEQTARSADQFEFVARADHVRLFCGGRLEPCRGENVPVGGFAHQTLYPAVEAGREPQVVRGQRDSGLRCDSQQVSRQQHRRPERFAVLRRHRNDQPADLSVREAVERIVVSAMERVRRIAGWQTRAKSLASGGRVPPLPVVLKAA